MRLCDGLARFVGLAPLLCSDAAADIEDITHKTGNHKRFAVFVEMLLSAISQRSDSVYVDLLTYADLVSCGIGALRCSAARAPSRRPRRGADRLPE